MGKTRYVYYSFRVQFILFLIGIILFCLPVHRWVGRHSIVPSIVNVIAGLLMLQIDLRRKVRGEWANRADPPGFPVVPLKDDKT